MKNTDNMVIPELFIIPSESENSASRCGFSFFLKKLIRAIFDFGKII